MRKMQRLTVNGETYQICDPDAARLDDAGIGNSAWSAKNTVDRLCPAFCESGVAVRCEPVEGYPLSITAEEGSTTISRCGKNLIDYTQAIPRNANSVVNIIKNGVSWESGTYFFFVPCAVRAGETVTFSCEDEADAVSYAMLYDRVKKVACSAQEYLGKPMVATADADAVCVYKKSPQTAITTPIVLTELQLECGPIATAYEPYKAIETFVPGEDIPAWSGVNTIWADSGMVNVKGKADPTAIIEKLTKAVDELTKATVSLGGNV